MDRIQATPRVNPTIGGLADLLASSYSPQRTQQMQGLMNFLGVPAVAQTLDRISYGEPITTGRGMTTELRPEAKSTLGALLGLVPIGRAAAPAAEAATMAAGRAGERVAERAVPRIMQGGGLPAEMLGAMAQGSQSQVIRRVGEMGFDPRFDKRKKERPRLAQLTTDVDEPAVDVPTLSLVDFEGRPFLTSMSDRTGVGLLQSINDVNLNRPVYMGGGQDYMFNNPDRVWATAKGPSKKILEEAQIIKQITGQNPLFLPWTMAPSGGDFSNMTGEAMLSFAEANMTKRGKQALNKQIKQVLPDWYGVDDPRSATQFAKASDSKRKKLKKMMDVQFRDEGGLSIGEARLSVADTKQLMTPDGSLLNVGEIFPDMPLSTQSGHTAYPYAVPGRGIARLKENVNVFQLMPNVVQARGIPDPMNPRQTDLRALQMKPYAGVITEGLLKQLGY